MERIFLIVLIILSFLSGCSSSYIEYEPQKPAIQREIKWQEYSNTILIGAKAAHKPVLIYFTLKDCPDCELLGQSLENPELVYFIMENFVPIKVYLDSEAYSSVLPIPTLVVFSSSDQAELGRIILLADYKQIIAFLNESLVLDLATNNKLEEYNESL